MFVFNFVYDKKLGHQMIFTQLKNNEKSISLRLMRQRILKQLNKLQRSWKLKMKEKQQLQRSWKRNKIKKQNKLQWSWKRKKKKKQLLQQNWKLNRIKKQQQIMRNSKHWFKSQFSILKTKD